MQFSDFYAKAGERPLDTLKPDGGLFAVFRTVGVIGDSLSAGETESRDAAGNPGWNDYPEYSWGQYMARAAGCTVHVFARGGMTSKEFCTGWGAQNNVYDPEKAAQAYIVALGVNDLRWAGMATGSMEDALVPDGAPVPDTFAGYIGKIIRDYRKIAPKSRFFLMTPPAEVHKENKWEDKKEWMARFYTELAARMDFVYVLDLFHEAPVYDDEYAKHFKLGGHLTASGYLVTAQMVMTYIDWIIRNNEEDFAQIAFVGKGGIHYEGRKW